MESDKSAYNCIVLVACVKRKVDTPDGPVPAKELYQSPLFRKSLEYAERILKVPEERIFILSAKYHLLPLNTPVTKYEKTLNNAREAEKKVWADKVWSQLSSRYSKDTHYIILAGENYYKYLVTDNRIKDPELPLRGLRMGQRLSALKSALENNTNIRPL